MASQVGYATIADVVQFAKRFDSVRLLVGVNRLAVRADAEPNRVLSIDRWDESPISRRIHLLFATHSIAATAKLAIACYGNSGTEIPSTNQIEYLVNQVANLPSSHGPEDMTLESIDNLMSQIGFQQFEFQRRNEGRNLGRMLVLFRDIPKLLADEGQDVPYDLDAEFQTFTGLTISQFVWTGTMIWGGLITSPIQRVNITADGTNMRRSWRGDPKDLPNEDRIRKFLSHTATPIEDLQATVGSPDNLEVEDLTLDFTPLRSYPVVLLDEDRFIAPIPKLLIDRYSLGIFHDFASHLHEKEAPFRAYFGHLFERYVGLQLQSLFETEHMTPETVYTVPWVSDDSPRRDWSTPDWTVDSVDGSAAIECKSRQFTRLARLAPTRDRVIRDLDLMATDAMARLGTKVQDIEKGFTVIREGAADGMMQTLCTFERLTPLMMYGTTLHGLLKDKLKREPDPFHILDIDSLERLCATGERATFFAGLEILRFRENWTNPLNPGPEGELEQLLEDKPFRNPVADGAYDVFKSAIPPLLYLPRTSQRADLGPC